MNRSMPFSAPGSALNSRRRSKSAVSISVGTLVSVDLPSATRVAADSVGVRLAAAQSRNARPNCSFPMHFCRFATLIVPPSQELLDAFEQCSSPIPLELDGGIGDGAVPPPIEHTATQVPASDLAIEVLAYLSRELDSTELAAVVITTNAGDFTELSDEALAALATCGFES